MNEKANRGNGKWIFTKFYTISHVCWGGSDIILLFTIIAEKMLSRFPIRSVLSLQISQSDVGRT